MLDKPGDRPDRASRHFELRLPGHAPPHAKTDAGAGGAGSTGYTKSDTAGLTVGDQRLDTAAAERTRHPQQMNSFENTGLAAAVTAEKNIHPRQILQRDLLQVPHIVYLQAG